MSLLKVEAIDMTRENIACMDSMLLNQSGRLCLFPAGVYGGIQPLALRAWCSVRGRYGLPTVELCNWLASRIGDRTAIEIGAGCGDLGFRLGIPMTDSYQQVDDQQTAAFLKFFGSAPTRPPPDVVKVDAESTVIRCKPNVVVASWVTQRFLPGDTEGNLHGPREEVILENCGEYIFIGNEAVHGTKRIMKLPHETFYFPWLVSRAREQSLNRIYIWPGKLK